MSLAPVPGPLSIATGTVIVEVLVGWSLALLRRFRSPPPSQKRPGVRADFLHTKKKKKIDCFRQFTTAIRHIKDDRIKGIDNNVPDNLLEAIGKSVDHQTLAAAQEKDTELREIIKSGSSALQLEKIRFPDQDVGIYCNFSHERPQRKQRKQQRSNRERKHQEQVRYSIWTKSSFFRLFFFFFLSTNQSKLVLCKQQWCNRYSNVSYHIKKY